MEKKFMTCPCCNTTSLVDDIDIEYEDDDGNLQKSKLKDAPDDIRELFLTEMEEWISNAQ